MKDLIRTHPGPVTWLAACILPALAAIVLAGWMLFCPLVGDPPGHGNRPAGRAAKPRPRAEPLNAAYLAEALKACATDPEDEALRRALTFVEQFRSRPETRHDKR